MFGGIPVKLGLILSKRIKYKTFKGTDCLFAVFTNIRDVYQTFRFIRNGKIISCFTLIDVPALLPAELEIVFVVHNYE